MSILSAFILITSIGTVCGFILILSSHFLSVKTDPKLDEVLNLLPNVNCGACGYAGCSAAAQAVVKGERGPDVCVIAPKEISEAIAKVMGIGIPLQKKKKVAYLMCSRNRSEVEKHFLYKGVEECIAASLVYGGEKSCSGGCIGFGTCKTVCPVSAIKIIDELPVIDTKRCTGCGLCVEICPKKILALIEDTEEAKNKKRCLEFCKRNNLKFEVDEKKCIKCGLCFKNCPSDAIKWEKGKVAFIQKDRCTQCLTCLRCCPVKCIS
ncbi:MAG: RnfABCDGE type electron transport complex subunit B [Chitinispirillaceae bacterium]|nr:RnfABCDGE type electron transport complex subunit B [Chitinispirillaceae bacterium]